MADKIPDSYLSREAMEEGSLKLAEGDQTALSDQKLRKSTDDRAPDLGTDTQDNLAKLDNTRATPKAPPIEPNQSENMGGTNEEESPLTGPGALVKILKREGWNTFGFVLFRTFYQDEALWERFLEEYEAILRQELYSANPNIDKGDILGRLQMEVVSDDCMENKMPAHIALAYRIFDDVEPGLKTKMCLIVDKECMESVAVKDSRFIPFVKAVDVILGADAQSAFPRVIKVAISSLLARFYPALANCDSVWEIMSDGDDVWTDWPTSAEDGAV